MTSIAQSSNIGESGKLYLAAILDLLSGFIVGWAPGCFSKNEEAWTGSRRRHAPTWSPHTLHDRPIGKGITIPS